MHVSELNQYPLRRFHHLFASLDIPKRDELAGKYQGAFVGPAWVRTLARPALFLVGLGGWWGKELYEDGLAINILLRQEKMTTRFRMKLVEERSHIDGREGLSLYYERDNLILWLFIADEIRRLDQSTLLGMTRPSIPGLRWLAFPFLLEKQENQVFFSGNNTV
jgi:hypothetical protein